ncbi:MAG: MerR family transcriptional regulator [Solidesulfovibrio sp. DCME]|uniref:MerR family transcriptional regulator n=1 Tax=Solidesulfovibrio sp. DCME TaxID=3447380 RepID=UPI003D0DAE60
MADTRLYSVAALAKLLDIPESTLHYWKNRFDDVLPSVGVGRGKRFRAEAVDIFRSIGRLLGQGLSAADVRAELARNHPINITPRPRQLNDPTPPLPAAGDAALLAAPTGEAALVMAAHIGSEIARSLVSHLNQHLSPARPALPDEAAEALRRELTAVRAENEALTEKMQLLETELVRLRKDRRELEHYLVDKINALRRPDPAS